MRYGLEQLQAVLAAAPNLELLEVNVICGAGYERGAEEAHAVLRGVPPFGPVRVRGLSAHAVEGGAAAVAALAADIVAHKGALTSLELNADDAFTDPASAAAMNALAAAALRCRLSRFEILGGASYLGPHCAPALARLLCGNVHIQDLSINNYGSRLLDKPGAALLGAALRACPSIEVLSLQSTELFTDLEVAQAVIGGATAHPSLRMLVLSPGGGGEPEELSAAAQAAAGAALGALVAANAPALEELHISFCGLGDAGLRPVAQALRANTHLTQLECKGNGATEQWARDDLLPAVRANTALQRLGAAAYGTHGAAQQAEAVVEARQRQR
jgi:hypothetical protein